jgi:adenosine deaminase
MLSLLRREVKITINSDDPAYFRGYVSENVTMMAKETNVTKEELVQFQRNAFQISWISESKRQGFLEKLEQYAASGA